MTTDHETTAPRAFGIGPSLSCLIAAIAYGVLVFVTSRYYFRYPFSDEWSFIPLLVKGFEGELTWRDFWAPYHGHRLLFARLIMVPLALATHWDTRWFVAANLLLGLALFLLCAVLVRRAFRVMGLPFPWISIPLLALLIFSLNQWCNWAWGWQMLVYLSVVSSVASLMLLSHPRGGILRLCFAMFFGVVASFSFATGIVVWAAGLVVLLLPRLQGQALPTGAIASWLVTACAVSAAYITGFEHPEYHESGTFLPGNVLVVIPYTAVYIGASVTFFRDWAALPVGLAAIAFAVVSHLYLIRQRVPAAALAPFTGLMTFALGSGFLTGLGRSAHYGIQQAAVARYFTISELFWAGIVFLLCAIPAVSSRDRTYERARPVRWAVSVALAALIGMSLLSSRLGYYKMDEHYTVYMPEARRMVAADLVEVPQRLNPTHHSLAEELASLKRWELFPFRPQSVRYWHNLEIPPWEPASP